MVEGRGGPGLMAVVAAAFVALSLIVTLFVLDAAEYNGQYPVETGDKMEYGYSTISLNGWDNYTVVYTATMVNDSTVLFTGVSAERPNLYSGMVLERSLDKHVPDDAGWTLVGLEMLGTPLGQRMVWHYLVPIDGSHRDVYIGSNGITYKIMDAQGNISMQLLASDIEWV
jgi:hypothetical protein